MTAPVPIALLMSLAQLLGTLLGSTGGSDAPPGPSVPETPGAPLALPPLPAEHSLQNVTLSPSQIPASLAPTTVTLRVNLELPPGPALVQHAGEAIYDRVSLRAPPGFTFGTAGVSLGGGASAAYPFANASCRFTAPEPVRWADFWIRGVPFSPNPDQHHYACRGGGLTNVTLSNPVRDPRLALEVTLSNFVAPTVAGDYTFQVDLLKTLGGLDHAVGVSFPAAAVENACTALPPEVLSILPPEARALLDDTACRANVVGTHNVTFTVVPGPLHRLRVEDAAGLAVDDLEVTADDTLTVFSRGYDEFANLIGDVVTSWTATNTLDAVPAGPSTNVAFDPVHAPTNGTLAADAAALAAPFDDATGLIRVLVGALHHLEFVEAPTTTTADVSVNFTAVAHDSDHNHRSDAITYSIDSGSGGIDPTTGRFTPAGLGTTVINATAGGRWATTSIDVTAGALDHVEFTAAPNATDADTAVAFTAVAHDVHHNLRNDPIAYSIASGSGSIHATTGGFTPDRVGSTVVRAAAGAKSATATIEVSVGVLDHVEFTVAPASTPADVAVTFEAKAHDAHHNNRTEAVTYSIDSGSGSINATTGLFVPDETGTAIINATTGGRWNTTSITVTAGGLDHVEFTVAPDATDADTPVTFTAVAHDVHHNTRGDTITFSMVSGSGSINATSGEFTPDLVGTTRVRATAGGVFADADIAVSVGAFDHVEFTTAPNTTDADAAVDFVAVAHDRNHNNRTDAVTYSIDSGSGSINATSGRFEPDQAGPTVVNASSDDAWATTTINVTAGGLDHVEFTVAPNATDADTAVTFVAVTHDAHHNARTDAIAYSIVSGSGSINATSGEFTPDLVGTTRVRATAGGAFVEAEIVVSAGAPDHVEFTDAPAETDATTSVTFVAVAHDARHNARAETIAYSIDAGNGSIHATTGLFEPDGTGTTVVNATAADHWATTSIAVTIGAPVTLSLDCPESTTVGEAVACSLSGTDADGNPANVSGAEFSALDAHGVELDADGDGSFAAPTLVADGPVEVLATRSGLTSNAESIGLVPGAAATVAVAPDALLIAEGGTRMFEAVARDAHGNAVSGADFSWSVDHEAVGSIDATGLFTAVSTGATTVDALEDASGVTGTAAVTVTAQTPEPASLRLTPSAATVRAGDATTFTAEALDANGTLIDGVAIDLVTTNATHGTIDADGVFTGHKVGSVEVIATSGGLEERAAVTVDVGALAQLRIAPVAATIAGGGAVDFTATGYDLQNNPLAGVSIGWSLDDAALGSIDSGGHFSGAPGAGGVATVTASAGGFSRSASVHITDARADAGTTTRVNASVVTTVVGDANVTTYAAGFASVAAGAAVLLEAPASGSGFLSEARIVTESASSNVSFVVETQDSTNGTVPEEVDAGDLVRFRADLGAPHASAAFLTVGATEGGTSANASRLNALLQQVRVTFRVPQAYFNTTGLDPAQARLVEYSDGRRIQDAVPVALASTTPVAGVYEYSATLTQFSSFALVIPRTVAGGVASGGGGGCAASPLHSVLTSDAEVPEVELRFATARCGTSFGVTVLTHASDRAPPGLPPLPAGVTVHRYVEVSAFPELGPVESVRIRLRLPADGVTSPAQGLLLHARAQAWTSEGPLGLVRDGDAWTAATTAGCCSVFAVAFDALSPTVRLVAPPRLLTTASTVVAEASDNVAISQVEFLVDGEVQAVRRLGPYSFELDPTRLAPGAHVLRATALDVVGNPGSDESRFEVTGDGSGRGAVVSPPSSSARGALLVGLALLVIGALAAGGILFLRARRSGGKLRESPTPGAEAPDSDGSAAPVPEAAAAPPRRPQGRPRRRRRRAPNRAAAP